MARDTMVSLPSERSGVPSRSLSMAALIPARSSMAVAWFRRDAGAGVTFRDLFQRGGALGKPLADRLGGQRAGGFGAQPGGFGGQGLDVLVGAGDVGACGVAPV